MKRRNGKVCVGVLCFLVLLGLNMSKAEALIVINEILADPPAGINGDANHDGTTSSTQDEFIELINFGSESVDLAGWSLHDAVSSRYTFGPSTVVAPYQFVTVYGGGTPNLPGVLTFASGGLSLNNTGETVSLFDAQGNLVDKVVYGAEGNKDQSITRSPDASGLFVLHSQAGHGAYSPGTQADGSLYPPPQIVLDPALPSAAVPEPATLLSMAIGLGALARARKMKMLG